MLKSTTFEADGETYYVNNLGKLAKDKLVTLEDGLHYFDKDGHMVRNTTITKYFRKYTFDDNGVYVP